MVVSRSVRLQVQSRANFACEYCGVSEVNTGGELTVDHFQPTSLDGSDELDNLIYCCFRCNQYKGDYWPDSPAKPMLWNPRTESFHEHFVVIETGTLEPLTKKGAFTIQLLRLNRPHLVEHRLHQQRERIRTQLLEQLSRLLQSYEFISMQEANLVESQLKLLDEQISLMRRLLG